MRILAISLIAAVFVATVGLGWLFDRLYDEYLKDDSDVPITSLSAIEAFGSDLQHMLFGTELAPKDVATLIASWPVDGNYQLSLLPVNSLALPDNLKKRLLDGEPLTLASEDDIAIYYYLPMGQQLLVLTSSLLNRQAPSNLNRYLLTGLFYLCLLLLMLLWLYPLLKRLLALRAAAKSFGQGQLEQRVQVGSVSYIRDLELEFNHMAQRIGDLVADVKLLSSAVSHDLRTPLATIRFGIDTLREEEDPVLRKKFEQRISDNVDEMIELVEILLNYARLDQSLVTLEKTHVLLTPLLEQIVSNHQGERVLLELVPIDGDIRVVADKGYLLMLLNNLIKNAVQHCRAKVRLDVVRDAGGVIISVGDDGKGIAPEERAKIVKPFVRGKAEHKGYGIGLAIVQRILHWHKGWLEIGKDQELGGARFSVWLPKND